MDGFEPPTCWLQISCSTNWANAAYWAYHISRYKIVSRIFYIALDKPLILKIRKNIAIKGVWKWAYFSRGYYLHTVVILGLYVHTTYGTRYFRPNMLVSSLGNLSPLSATNGLHIGFTLSLPSFHLRHSEWFSRPQDRIRTCTIKINTNDLITGITYLIVLGDFTVATRHQPFLSGTKHSSSNMSLTYTEAFRVK